MSRKEGKSYLVDDDWRIRVELRLKEKGWSRADLARESKCSRSTITDLLNGNQDGALRIPAIHKALDWPPPLPPLLSKDAGELIGIWERLDDMEKGRLLERARAIFEAQLTAAAPRRRS